MSQLVQDIPERDRPIAEQFRIVALQYVDAESAASLLEEMKTTTLARMKLSLIQSEGPMADNKAEMTVKASPDWSDYIKSMVDARGKALKLKLQMTYIQMLERQEDRSNWLARTERTMGRSGV